MVHFSGFARKMNHIPLSRERSERENQQFRFYVWFQIYNKKEVAFNDVRATLKVPERHFSTNSFNYYTLLFAKEREVVHFSGKTRKTNHIPLFCERSLFTSRKPSGELWAK
ncbi:MAG: hypothetical protein U5L45_23195 [Saprospiraceae bacterium]|nr:hypothetical protein [Saprospiraceae bacterium]